MFQSFLSERYIKGSIPPPFRTNKEIKELNEEGFNVRFTTLRKDEQHSGRGKRRPRD